MGDKIKFDVDNYEPSDSEEEYTARERSLISKVRQSNKKQVESDEEVLRFSGSDDDDNEDIKKFQDSGSEDEEEDDGLPDSRAWGKKKRSYYNTDFVDKDYSQYTQEEEEIAAQEWEEAKQIRQRLTKQLNDNDFSLDVFTDKNEVLKEDSLEETEEGKLKTDLSDLSEREKKQLFKRDAPEFDGLLEDMFGHLEESENILTPFLDYCKENVVPDIPVIKFAKIFNSLLLNYSNNVSFYLLLKSKRIPIKNHPVVKRLVQVRKLIEQLNERYQDIVRPQLETFLEDLKAENVKCITSLKAQNAQSKKMLNIMKPFEENNLSEDEEGSEDDFLEEGPKLKKARKMEDENMEVDETAEIDEEVEEVDDDDEIGKRGITYQMSKNKGLTPRKKPELRNPRVKNRSKYRKAVIRRKGSVREVRKETSRYGGEATGIKAFVKRSVSIK